MKLPPRSSSTLRRHGRLAVVLLGAVAAIMVASIGSRHFVWNLSPSVPRGLYILDRSAAPIRGAIVTFPPPANAAAVITARRYLPGGVSLIKTVVALPGDAVCIDEFAFSVSGRIIGAIAHHDSVGRPLDSFRFCGAVSPGSTFVATAAQLSFDSRYFGPVPLSTLTVAIPVWTY
jgi:conjugative transfer signal peptidase TraF